MKKKVVQWLTASTVKIHCIKVRERKVESETAATATAGIAHYQKFAFAEIILISSHLCAIFLVLLVLLLYFVHIFSCDSHFERLENGINFVCGPHQYKTADRKKEVHIYDVYIYIVVNVGQISS